MWSEVTETLAAHLRDAPAIAKRLPNIESKVRAGALAPTAAATKLLAAFLGEDGA